MRLTTRMAVLEGLHASAWAAYFTLTRMTYSGDPRFLVLLASAESMPSLGALLGGWISTRRGYKASLLIGVGEGLGLAAAGLSMENKNLLWTSVLAAKIAGAISGPQIYAMLLTASGGSAASLGTVTAVVAAGGMLGSFAPIAAAKVGAPPIIAVMGVMVAGIYLAMARLAGSLKPRNTALRLRGGRIPHIVFGIAVALAGLGIIGSVYMARLSRELGPTLYSATNAGSGLMGALSRPFVGRLVDSAGALKVLPIILVSYAVYAVLLDVSHGIAMALLWILPLYPFFDLSLYKITAAAAGESMGPALISLGGSLSGIILMFYGALGLTGVRLLLLAVSSLLLAIPLTVGFTPRRVQRMVAQA